MLMLDSTRMDFLRASFLSTTCFPSKQMNGAGRLSVEIRWEVLLFCILTGTHLTSVRFQIPFKGFIKSPFFRI
jgi:hypothetical protein